VQWSLIRADGEVMSFLGVERAPPSFLKDLAYRGLTRPPYFVDEPRGLKFQAIINASDSGLYLDESSGRSFTSHYKDVDRWSAACVFTSLAAAAQFWPWLGDQPKADADLKVTQGRRSPRGAKTVFDWEKALIEGCGFLIENGLPEDQADLIAYIADWFGDEGPGDTQIKEHLAPLYRRAKQAFSR
jgi:hypothetical protein